MSVKQSKTTTNMSDNSADALTTVRERELPAADRCFISLWLKTNVSLIKLFCSCDLLLLKGLGLYEKQDAAACACFVSFVLAIKLLVWFLCC